MKQVRLLNLYPLNRGLDKTSIAGTQDPRSLKRAKNVMSGLRPSLKRRPGTRRIPYIGQDGGVQAIAHFFGTTGSGQFQEIIRVRKGQVEVLRDLSGSKPQFVDLGLAVSPTDTVVFERFSNALVLHFENTRAYAYTVGGTLIPLPLFASHISSPPTFGRRHEFRYWYSGRSANPHIVYAGAPNSLTDYTLYSGGFSMRINDGDGDPVGITGISPPFRGEIYVYKWGNTYRVYRGGDGYGWSEESNEIGAVHHNAIVSTKMDLYSVDVSGIQSLMMSRQYDSGSGETALTGPIYEWFQDSVNWSQAKNMLLLYDKATGNLLLSYAKSGSSVNNSVLSMNVFSRQFFEWEDIEYPAMTRYYDFGKPRILVADETRGLSVIDKDELTLNGDPINIEVETGTIFPMGNPKTQSSFTQAWLACKPTERSSIVKIYYSIDGQEESVKEVEMLAGSFGTTINDSVDEGGELIGSDIIGRIDSEMATIPFEFLGEGASVRFRVVQEPTEADPAKELELFGILVEYENFEDTELKVTS